MQLPKGILEREAAHSKLSTAELEEIDALGTRYFSDQEAIDQLLRKWAESKEFCTVWTPFCSFHSR